MDGCENTSYSHKRNRLYCRAFNYQECRDLRAQGWTYKRLADHFGVNPSVVVRACDAKQRARIDARVAAHNMSGVCSVCGKPGVAKYAHRGDEPRCRACANRARRLESFRLEGDTVTAVWCGRCEEWKTPELFPVKLRDPERGVRKRRCTACETAARRDYRARHKVPCANCGTPCLPASEKRRVNRETNPSPYCLPCWHEVVRNAAA